MSDGPDRPRRQRSHALDPGFPLWAEDPAPGAGVSENAEPAASSWRSDLSLEERINLLPSRPGVYLMKDGAGVVLYVGKAASIRSRVRSYFRGGDERLLVRFLRARIDDVQFIVTDTEKEAILLENNLIKKHKPRYNIQLRDDKTYVSLRLDTRAEWPRLQRARRRRAGDRALHFGPYSSSVAVKHTLRFLQRIFPLRSCPDSVLRHRSRPCILHQIGRCSAPCVGLVERAQYEEMVRGTILFLRGQRREAIGILRDRMIACSEAMEFEKAAVLRDQIAALEQTVEPEKVHSHRFFDRDVIALQRRQGRMLFTVLLYRGGKLDSMRHLDFRDHGLEDEELMDSFLAQFYSSQPVIPRDVLVSHAPANISETSSLMSDWRGSPVRIHRPERGEKRRILELALHNGAQVLDRLLAGEKSRESVLRDLQEKLHLPQLPHRIECYDISTFQGSFPAGAMTVLLDGEPAKSEYRLFRIRTVAGQDDFAMMREMLTRRFRRALADGKPLPDLVLIDGGKGQLGVAVEVWRELGLTIPVAGLAKARNIAPARRGTAEPQSTEERIFLPGRKNPVFFNRGNPALNLLTRLRDEAHRFVITYHRKLRVKSALRSSLDDVPGVGPARRKALLKHFGSLTRLREATAEQIAAVPGIPTALAAVIKAALQGPAAPPPQVDTAERDSHGGSEGS